MDTRVKLFLLLDYNTYYGEDKTYSDAQKLIQEIPSVTLLSYISGFNVNLYLNDNTDHSGKVQFLLVDNLLSKCGKNAQDKWNSVISAQAEKGHSPLLFWSYSNLLFYGLIFSKFNYYSSRDLTNVEAQKVFDAYLIINGIANKKVQIEPEQIQSAAEEEKIEEVIMPNFIYQKDYASTIDFTNQVARGAKFFQYLENHTIYGPIVTEYYKTKKVSGYLRMFKNLMILVSEINIGQDLQQRNQLANLEKYFISKDVDLGYIETLCVNSEIENYSEDQSFGVLRNKLLYKLNNFQYFILDVNFLIDQFYKAQVFSFYQFLKKKGINGDFLSEKGKNFTDKIYLPEVLKKCFPNYINFFGDDCINSSKGELADAYLRNNHKICIIEFKDVLLNATVKNSADKEILFSEFDKKFVANQKKKAKGITQLINAIKDIEKHSITFDLNIPNTGLEIFPVIIYTDFSFGIEGINKIYKEKFRGKIDALNIKNITIKDLTFINLNFFEIQGDYFAKNLMNLFVVLEMYHQHTTNPDYHLTVFEVYIRFYMQKYIQVDLGLPQSYQNILHDITLAL